MDIIWYPEKKTFITTFRYSWAASFYFASIYVTETIYLHGEKKFDGPTFSNTLLVRTFTAMRATEILLSTQ